MTTHKKPTPLSLFPPANTRGPFCSYRERLIADWLESVPATEPIGATAERLIDGLTIPEMVAVLHELARRRLDAP